MHFTVQGEKLGSRQGRDHLKLYGNSLSELWKRHPICGPPSMVASPHVLLALPRMLPTWPPTMPSIFHSHLLGKALSPTHTTGGKTEAQRPRAPDWDQPE